MVTVSNDLKKHIPEESVFKHDFNVKRPEKETGKVINFDHKHIERTALSVAFHFHHKERPPPQIHLPPKIRAGGREHRFNVVRPLPPPLKLKRRLKRGAPTRETLLKKTFIESPENPYITYYGPVGGSFGVVSKYHMRNLPFAGWNVYWVTLADMAKYAIGYPSQIGVIHPVLFSFFTSFGFNGWNQLRLAHNKLAGFEVADSDAISETGIKIVENVDLLMVPSETSKKAFVNSGLHIPIEVIPHGVSQLYNAPKKPLSQVPQNGIKVLFFEVHSKWRKAGDVVWKVMSRMLKERPDVQFVFRGGRENVLCKLPRTTCFSSWMSDPDLVSLYDSCDILIAPSRGGAFELNVLEAMARGLIVETSSWSAITEYAEGALLIKSKGRVAPLPGNPIHIGKGVNPDPDHAYEQLNCAIDNLPELKRDAEDLAPKIREKYNWRNTAQKMADVLGTLR